MLRGESGIVSRQLSRLFQIGPVSGLSEGALLDRFVHRRDEAAFEAILSRHGPMVLSVCRKWLDDPNDVDDAFQATFLVLVRRAGSLRQRDLLGNWLFGVAQKVARRARIDAGRRRDRERKAAQEAAMTTAPTDPPEDVRPLYEEIGRLSDSDRATILLCDLQGLTHAEAADQLGWPIGTVKGRLFRARERLRGRLSRRGVTVPSVALAAALAREGRAAVPEALLASTIRSAVAIAAGRSIAAGVVSASAASLTQGVVSTMIRTKIQTIGAIALGLGAFSAGAVALTLQQVPGDARTGASSSSETAPAKQDGAEALARAEAAREAFAAQLKQREKEIAARFDELRPYYEKGQIDINHYFAALTGLMEARLDAASSSAERRQAIETYLTEAEKLIAREQEAIKVGKRPGQGIEEARAAVLNAKFLLARHQGGEVAAQDRPDRPSTGAKLSAGNVEDPPDDAAEEAKNALILAQLDRIVSMNFAAETPLEEVVKYIKQATATPELPEGLPIYIAPQALMDFSGKKQDSMVQLSLEGVALKRTLKLMLEQIGLAYTVEHGLLVIDGAQSPRMPWVKERMKVMRERAIANRPAGGLPMSPVGPGPATKDGDSARGKPAPASSKVAGDSPAVQTLAKEKLRLARLMFEMSHKLYQEGQLSLSDFQEAARKVAEAEFEAASTDEQRVAALRSQFKIAKQAEEITAEKVQRAQASQADLFRAQIARLEVESKLAKMGQAVDPTPSQPAPAVNVPAPPAAP